MGYRLLSITPPLLSPTLRFSLPRSGVKLKPLRSVNNYRQSDRQHNWTYTELRYDDRQIPIKLIHFIAFFLWLSYVWAALNPLTEASDTYAEISALAGPVHGWRLVGFFFFPLYIRSRNVKLSEEPRVPKRYRVLTSDVLVGTSNLVPGRRFRPSNLASASLGSRMADAPVTSAVKGISFIALL